MTSIEKKMLWGLLACVVLLGFSVFTLFTSIEKAGGVKAIAIEAGKDIKDIAKEVKDHQ